MEFFNFAQVYTDEPTIRKELTVERLTEFCASIYELIEIGQDEARVLCLWGEFDVRKENINGGVRFTMPNCPNALAWTITTGFPPEPRMVVIHGTINRTEQDPGLLQSIKAFLNDWKEGIEATFGVSAAPATEIAQIGDLRKIAT
jgi:hypothetical protein